MHEHGQSIAIDTGERHPKTTKRFFQARIGRFEAAADRALMDDLAAWVENSYREELKARPSKHVYLSTLPHEIQVKMDRLRDNQVIRDAIFEQFDDSVTLVPMKTTDELYISHYNKDFGGDHGLFTKHYDGNLRFMPIGAVVRSLIYLQSDATYKVVFADSQVEKAFETYDFGILDFHKELHWVEGDYNPDDQQRILLKCNYLVSPKNAVWLTKALLAANTGVFYLVKSAMEYSKSPTTPFQYAVGYLCNVMRLLNNLHPLVPILLILGLFIALIWGLMA